MLNKIYHMLSVVSVVAYACFWSFENHSPPWWSLLQNCSSSIVNILNAYICGSRM